MCYCDEVVWEAKCTVGVLGNSVEMKGLCPRMRKSVQATGQEKDSFDSCLQVKQEETSRSGGSIVVLLRRDGEANARCCCVSAGPVRTSSPLTGPSLRTHRCAFILLEPVVLSCLFKSNTGRRHLSGLLFSFISIFLNCS